MSSSPHAQLWSLVARKKCDPLMVAHLLGAGAIDVNGRGPGLRTPLMMAVQRGHAEVVPLLLAAGADVTLVARDGQTAVSMAAYAGDVDTLDRLLRIFGPLDADQGGQLLWMAVKGCKTATREAVVQRVLAHGVSPDAAHHGALVMTSLVVDNDVQAIGWLLRAGAQVNGPVGNKSVHEHLHASPLYMAMKTGRWQLAHLFMQHGALTGSVQAATLMQLVLWCPPRRGSLRVVQPLLPWLSHISEDLATTLMMHAARQGHTRILRSMVAAGFTLPPKDPKYRHRVLTATLAQSHPGVLQVMFSHGLLPAGAGMDWKVVIDIVLPLHPEGTPLAPDRRGRGQATLDVLLRHGLAQAWSKDPSLDHPMLAVLGAYGSPTCLGYPVVRAALDRMEAAGLPIFAWAVAGAHPSFIAALLDEGADVMAQVTQAKPAKQYVGAGMRLVRGDTVAHVLVRRTSPLPPDMVSRLIDTMGEGSLAPNSDNKTPLDLIEPGQRARTVARLEAQMLHGLLPVSAARQPQVRL